MKRFALKLLQSCGVFALTRAASAHMGRILMYHNFSDSMDAGSADVTVSILRRQFEFLHRNYRVVPLSQLVEQLNSSKPIARNLVALTIDDGRRNCYQFLFPLLQEFGIPATFFVVSSFIRGEDWIWTDKVLWLSEQPGAPEELFSNKIDGFFALLNRMRPETRNAHIATLAKYLGVAIPQAAPSKYSPCTWKEIRKMTDSGLVEIGSHTVSHPIFSSITDEESWQELAISRSQIEEEIHKQVNSFCFPNGQPGDYRSNQLHQVKEAGYKNAVLASFGMVAKRSDPYQLPRLGVSGHCDDLTFAKYLDGAEACQMKIQKALGWVRP
jgi:peptidoglycan/xylan/chitin deacetylase (PgdA/CDA1 family)